MDETKTETLSIENDSNDAPPPEQKKLENEIIILKKIFYNKINVI